MKMLDRVKEVRAAIYGIARRYNAEKLWVFGSCARGEERPESDIDFLVKFGGPIGFGLVAFERELSDLLGRKAQISLNTTLLREPRFAARVCREAVEV